MYPSRALERAAEPLDVARRAAIAFGLKFRPTRALLLKREPRVAAHASIAILAALGFTAIAPGLLFVASPLALGVPHVASDVRYLLLRRSLPRWFLGAMFAACAMLFLLRLGEWSHAAQLPWARLELWTAELWIGAAIAFGAARARAPVRFAIAAAILLVLGSFAQAAPGSARLVFAHVHNLVGVGIWVFFFRRRRLFALPVLAALALALAFIFSGGAAAVARASGGLLFAGQDLGDATGWLAPGFAPAVGLSIALSYVFLQSVHYGVWLGWIPQEDMKAEGTPSFGMTVRGWMRDFGVGFWLIVALALLVAAAPIAFGPARTRDVYLSLATFHGYLELAMLGFLAMGPKVAPLAAA